MLRRFFAAAEPPASPTPNSLLLVGKLLELKRPGERSRFVLDHLVESLKGEVRGFAVRLHEGEAASVEAIAGYATPLLELRLEQGPWRDLRPRMISNLVAELFTPNRQEHRAQLGELGLREAKAALLAPVSGGELDYGALLLFRHDEGGFAEEDLQLAKHWGGVLGKVQAQQLELSRTRRSLVEFTRAFVEAIEAQDFTQLGHASRVTAYALSIGRQLGFTRKQQVDLYFAAMLHDVGKLGSGLDFSVEDSNHPLRGANLVASSLLLAEASDGIRTHHEHWNGSGFPVGLRKDEIPLLGRIVAVADTFDLLSSERGQALPLHEVEKALEQRSGRELDPELVNIFINILRQGRSTQDLGRLEEQDLPF